MSASFFNRVKVHNLDATEFEKTFKETKDAVLIDVRTEEENYHARIPNSILINIYESSFALEIEKLDKNKTYFIYCHSGSRSYSACTFMLQKGFEKVFNLQDGLVSWQSELDRN
jgi:rhodanese-related sulfurtransferase